MEHYKATIEYDGTDFYGFQRQPDARTVQGELERVLTTLQGGQPVKVRGAGRTDSGVHATGQVVDFNLRWRKDTAALLHALNGVLPDDVAIRELLPVPDDFHPRYDATSRVYVYTILNAPYPQPLLRRTTLHEPASLDTSVMNDAAGRLLGEHDFASFGRATSSTERTIRRMIDARVWREGALVKVRLEANAFLFRMVRGIVGCLLHIGRGERSPDWMDELLLARDRGEAAAVVAPTGLCLVAVRYANSPARSSSA